MTGEILKQHPKSLWGVSWTSARAFGKANFIVRENANHVGQHISHKKIEISLHTMNYMKNTGFVLRSSGITPK